MNTQMNNLKWLQNSKSELKQKEMNLKPPDNLNFVWNLDGNNTVWEQRCDFYSLAAGVTEEDD